jgi:hypothetical protein
MVNLSNKEIVATACHSLLANPGKFSELMLRQEKQRNGRMQEKPERGLLMTREPKDKYVMILAK